MGVFHRFFSLQKTATLSEWLHKSISATGCVLSVVLVESPISYWFLKQTLRCRNPCHSFSNQIEFLFVCFLYHFEYFPRYSRATLRTLGKQVLQYMP